MSSAATDQKSGRLEKRLVDAEKREMTEFTESWTSKSLRILSLCQRRLEGTAKRLCQQCHITNKMIRRGEEEKGIVVNSTRKDINDGQPMSEEARVITTWKIVT